MEDHEFFDLIYAHWAKTTGAENMFWMPEQDEEASEVYNIVAIGENNRRKHVASALSDEDSDFITAIHGCLPDLVRRLVMAVDEAHRLDYAMDEQTCRVAELEMSVDHFRAENGELRAALGAAARQEDSLREQLEFEREQTEFWRSHK